MAFRASLLTCFPPRATRWPLVFLLLLLAACGSTRDVVETDSDASRLPALIPFPASASFSGDERFTFFEGTPILVNLDDAETVRIARTLSGWIGNRVDARPPVQDEALGIDGAYVRVRRQADARLGEEGYDLSITRDSVILSASTHAGLFYGIQTIRQLLPHYVEYAGAFAPPPTLPVGRITDQPRFAWRGSMLDVARHFIRVQDVKRYIDLMALYKLNRLHLHLSDDQGWRIVIPGRPRLTEHGARTEVGGGEGGFYTRDDYAEIVRYASERYITIVPEIDMPGHTNAALASYPELTCDGKERDLYTGTEVGFSYLCVEKEETYRFVEDVVREIASLTPGAYFHLGGDEVDELTHEQYAAFMERAQSIVAANGKRVVGWADIAEVDLRLLPGAVVQVWRPQTPESAAHIASAVSEGARIVLSPADRIYIDMKYDSTTVPGLAWAGYNDVRDAYDWAPETFVPGVPESAILGVEAPLWTETLDNIHDIEYMALPRLAGVAEIAWSSATVRSWESYRRRVAAHAPRWTAMGVNFYRAPEIPWVRERIPVE